MTSIVSSVQSEQSFLGCILIDNSFDYKLEEVNEGYFSNEYTRQIFNSMMELKYDKLSIDLVSVFEKLKMKRLNIELSYLVDLTSICKTYSIDSYVNLLKEKYIRRTWAEKFQVTLNKIISGEDLDSTIFNFENETKNVFYEDTYKDDIYNISQSIMDLLEVGNVSNMKFGIKFLDEVIGGIYKGELTTIAAKSSVGKTSLALQIMLNVLKQGKKVLFITREMSKEQILMRNLTKKTGINTNKMKSGNIGAEEWKLIVEVLSEMNKDNLIFINDKIHTVAQIRKRIRQIKPDLLIVDYVQLMTPSNNLSNREREVAGISRDLKNITLDFNMSVIQLSQLNDEMKDFRPMGERPMRESKALFHDSNNVLYIHEPSEGDLEEAARKLGRSKESILNAKQNGIKLVEVIVAKCRDGEKKFKYFAYNGGRLHFEELKENIGGYVC